MEKKEILEHKIKTNEFIYTLDNNQDIKNELMEVIQMVLNQYIKYQNPNLDICYEPDRNNAIGYIKYCIQFKKDNENEYLYGIIEYLTNGLFDFMVNEETDSAQEVQRHLVKNIRTNYRNSQRVSREWFK